MSLARIGLGSNVGDSEAAIDGACAALERLGTIVARSSLYRTKAWGVLEQADFLNAAVLLETDRSPRGLLHALKAIETDLGRIPTFRWGPRSIDLDILAYDDVRVAEPDLVVPHARLFERAFALAAARRDRSGVSCRVRGAPGDGASGGAPRRLENGIL